MVAESFPYTDRQTTTDNRHARLDKGEAAYGVALKRDVNHISKTHTELPVAVRVARL